MIKPCPFCHYQHADFRDSHNWYCTQCGKDYADWLIGQKEAEKPLIENKGRRKTQKPLFSKQAIPEGAKPVRSAQGLLVGVVVVLALLSNANVVSFQWAYASSIPLLIYLVITMHQTGYAVGRYEVYTLKNQPILFRVHFWGFVFAIPAMLYLWLS